jgi:hypothetical protein
MPLTLSPDEALRCAIIGCYYAVVVANELVVGGEAITGVTAACTMTVRVEVLVRPWLSVTT